MAESPSDLQNEIEKLEMRHAENPEGRFFVPLANAYRKIGETETAEALLREGLRQHPDYLSAHIVLGRCLADRGATEEATQEFEYVLGMDPQNLIALRTLGELAMGSGRHDEARRWYEELLKVDPMNDEARRALEAVPSSSAEEGDFQEGGGWWEPPVEDVKDIPPAEAGWVIEEESEELPFIEREPIAPVSQSSEPYGDYIDLADEETTVDEGLDDDALISPSGELVTETIAELYARQGLVDRAADVYRELIRRRGGDAGLERRLADLLSSTGASAAAAATGTQWSSTPATQYEPTPPSPQTSEPSLSPAEPEPVAQSLPVEEAGPSAEEAEPFVEEAAAVEEPFAGWAQGEPPGVMADDESSPEAEREVVAAPDTAAYSDSFSDSFADGFEAEPAPSPAPGPTIAAFLAGLVSWRSAGDAVPVDQPDERAAPEASGTGIAEPESEPWTSAPEEPFILEEPSAEPWASDAAPEAVSQPVNDAPADLDIGDAFPWEAPASSSPASSDQPAAEATDSADELFSFDSFLGDSEADASPPAAPPEPSTPSTTAAASDEEDDLESFQAWLRSLKR